MEEFDPYYELADKEMEKVSTLSIEHPEIFTKNSQTIFAGFYVLIKEYSEISSELPEFGTNENIYLSAILNRTLNHYRGALWGLSTKNLHVMVDSERVVRNICIVALL